MPSRPRPVRAALLTATPMTLPSSLAPACRRGGLRAVRAADEGARAARHTPRVRPASRSRASSGQRVSPPSLATRHRRTPARKPRTPYRPWIIASLRHVLWLVRTLEWAWGWLLVIGFFLGMEVSIECWTGSGSRFASSPLAGANRTTTSPSLSLRVTASWPTHQLFETQPIPFGPGPGHAICKPRTGCVNEKLTHEHLYLVGNGGIILYRNSTIRRRRSPRPSWAP
jgi:hypothetical protein